jgi:hypothetical protein
LKSEIYKCCAASKGGTAKLLSKGRFMPEFESQETLSDDVIRRLQESLMRAVLLGQCLPGSDQPVKFPDITFISRQTSVVVADENLAGPISIGELSIPIRVLSREALMQEARVQGDVFFFQFRPPEIEDNEIQLALELRIAAKDPSHRPLGLSGIIARFRNLAGKWEIVDEPTFFAA